MASVKKIKEGLLCISWNASPDPSYAFNRGSRQLGRNTGNPTHVQVDVSTLTDIVDSFIFTCQVEGEQIVLEMEIYIASNAAMPVNRPALMQPGPASLKNNMDASDSFHLEYTFGTRQQMVDLTLKNTSAHTSRTNQQLSGMALQKTTNLIETPTLRVPNRGKQTGQFDWETILIYATKDCVQQKMTFNQSKWTATWKVSTNSGYQVYSLSFDILIDLIPEYEFSIKKGSKQVLDQLLNLWNTKTLSDITFNCKNHNIKAHSLILASGSPILAALFQGNHEKVFLIKDTNPSVFEALLCYIYTGDLNSRSNNVNVSELLVAADKYAVETLKEECALILSRNLKVENAANYLVLSYLNNSPKLYEASLDFITNNAKAVCSRKDWMAVIKNYPELCFQATQLMLGL